MIFDVFLQQNLILLYYLKCMSCLRVVLLLIHTIQLLKTLLINTPTLKLCQKSVSYNQAISYI